METHLLCLLITTNHKKTYKSLIDFLERLIVKYPSASFVFIKPVFQKSEVDKPHVSWWKAHMHKGQLFLLQKH